MISQYMYMIQQEQKDRYFNCDFMHVLESTKAEGKEN